MMHICVLNNDIRRIYQLSVRCLEKLFESHPCLLYFRHANKLTNCQPELSCPADYYIGDVDCLKLRVRGPHDVIELEKFLDYGENSCNWVMWVVYQLLDYVLPLQELVRHQLTIVIL